MNIGEGGVDDGKIRQDVALPMLFYIKYNKTE